MSPADRTPPPSRWSLRRYGRLAGAVVPAALIAATISAASLTTAQAADTDDAATPAASAPGFPWPDPYGDHRYPYPDEDPGPGPGPGRDPLLGPGRGPLLDDGLLLDLAGPLIGPGRGPFVAAPYPGPGRLSGCDIDSIGVANATDDRDFSVAVVRGRTFVGQRDTAWVGGAYTWQDLTRLPGYPVTGVCGASVSASSPTDLSVKVITFRGDVAESRCTTAGTLPVCTSWNPLQGPLQAPPPISVP
ncbi:hypothetical protein [Actinacidiphila sp. bgisy160]|uniref:hypothetical protein n=1 Tax=Actinacidiphila sp. bgisy160 TaxID=3413796 RepID=UPI003D710FCD